MGLNPTAWNRLRYTLWAPLYDFVARFGRQRRRSIALLGLQPGERVLLIGAGTGADRPRRSFRLAGRRPARPSPELDTGADPRPGSVKHRRVRSGARTSTPAAPRSPERSGRGSNDDQVFTYALEHGYVVLSSDERALWRPKRYREQGHPFPGMVCWPQRHRGRMTVGEAMEALEQMAQEDDPFAYGYRFIQPQP